MFCDITWGAGGSTADLTLDIASKMQNSVRAVLQQLPVVSCAQLAAHVIHRY